MPLNHMYEVYPNVSVNKDALISAIGWEYLRTNPATLKDGGSDLTQQQRGFQMINPTEAWFPGKNNYISLFSALIFKLNISFELSIKLFE